MGLNVLIENKVKMNGELIIPKKYCTYCKNVLITSNALLSKLHSSSHGTDK